MFKSLRGGFGIGSILAAALFIFGWTHFSEKVRELSRLGQTIKDQNEEIASVNSSIERIRTLKSLQVDLRLKLFGDADGAVPAVATKPSGRPFSAELLAAARKANVEFASYDPSAGGVTLKFWGRYPDVARFLDGAESAFPRIDRFSIEISKNGGVLMALTVPVGPA